MPVHNTPTIADLFGTERPQRRGRKDQRRVGMPKRLVPAPPTAPTAPIAVGQTTLLAHLAGETMDTGGVVADKAHPKPIETCVVEPVRPRHVNKVLPHLPPVRRNQPCPCGSGRKWKGCHGGNA